MSIMILPEKFGYIFYGCNLFGIVEQCRKYKLTNNLVSIIILGIEVGHKKIPGAYYQGIEGKPQHGT